MAALAAVAFLLHSSRTLCISSQAIYGFLAVATKPVAENGLGMKHADADTQLAKLLAGIEVLYDSAAVAAELRRLVVTHKVTGKKTHDARLVATMNVHGAVEILTFNGGDFGRYPAITILAPADVALGRLPTPTQPAS